MYQIEEQNSRILLFAKRNIYAFKIIVKNSEYFIAILEKLFAIEYYFLHKDSPKQANGH